VYSEAALKIKLSTLGIAATRVGAVIPKMAEHVKTMTRLVSALPIEVHVATIRKEMRKFILLSLTFNASDSAMSWK